MKKLTAVLVTVFLCLFFSYAEEIVTPIDGTGDEYEGGGNENNYWNMQQGVRVSMYDSNGQMVGRIVDYTNDTVYPIWHYHKKTKIDYLNGAPTALDLGSTYFKAKPSHPLPQIINIWKEGETEAQSNARMDAIKEYFGSIDKLKQIVIDLKTHIRYDEKLAKIDVDRADSKFIEDLKNYKLIIEPIAYFYMDGDLWAMTAAEAAKFPDTSNSMKTWLWPLTHSNQPLSIFPTEDTMVGSTLVPAYTGPRSGRFDNMTILKSMGVGVISFNKEGKPKPEIITEDYTYRCDTDVITSFVLYARDTYNYDDYINITFNFEGEDIDIPSVRVSNIFCPGGEQQVVWANWHTPETPKVVKIKITGEEVSIDGKGKVHYSPEFVMGYFSAVIKEDKELTPPDPKPMDRDNTFRVNYDASINPFGVEENTEAVWRIWRIRFLPFGFYEFYEDEYTASLDVEGNISPSRLSPTAYGKTMKSGYGLEAKIKAKEETDFYGGIVEAQRVKMYFPEFYYKDYNRILEKKRGKFIFNKNKFSQEYYLGSNEKSRVHFTPLWYPDMEYKVKYMMYDCWTPAGELRKIGEDSLTISGNMYQDWHIGPDYSR